MQWKLGSLFDGSGGFPLAGQMNGIIPAWASEIERYPIAVTSERFPLMKHLGDITKISGVENEPVDVITFGSPCQDQSVSGKQAGLSGDRSSLFFEAIRIIREMRDATHGEYPRFAIWENVPGAFSSNSGRDFKAVLEAFCAIGGYPDSLPDPPLQKGRLKWRTAGTIMGNGFSLAWRVLDAQYWGVPQRRRRIFLVVDFAGGCAGEILFDEEGLRWDSAPSGEARQRTAPAAEGGVDGCLFRESGHGYWTPGCGTLRTEGENRPSRPGHAIVYPDVSGTLCSRHDESPCIDRGQPFVAAFMSGQGAKAGGIGYQEEIAPTLKHSPGGNQIPSLCINALPVVFDAHGNGDGEVSMTITGSHEASLSDFANVVCFDTTSITCLDSRSNPKPNDPCHTLCSGQHPPLTIALQGNAIDRADTAGCNGCGFRDNVGYTLNTVDRHAVAFDTRNHCAAETNGTLQAKNTGGHSLNYINPVCYALQSFGEYVDTGVVSTQGERQYKYVTDIVVEHRPRYIVRRLTPVECARLQGFPDCWGNIPNKKLQSDSAQYRMWGNGVALPCVFYVLRGVARALRAAAAEERG